MSLIQSHVFQGLFGPSIRYSIRVFNSLLSLRVAATYKSTSENDRKCQPNCSRIPLSSGSSLHLNQIPVAIGLQHGQPPGKLTCLSLNTSLGTFSAANAGIQSHFRDIALFGTRGSPREARKSGFRSIT